MLARDAYGKHRASVPGIKSPAEANATHARTHSATCPLGLPWPRKMTLFSDNSANSKREKGVVKGP